MLRKLLGFMWREAREVFPTFVFFACAFSIIVITDTLADGVAVFRVMGAIVLAGIVSKTLLIVDFLPFVDAFRGKPLVYNVIWKASLYTVAVMLVRYLEVLVRFSLRYGLADANVRLMREVVWARYWAIQIWLVVIFTLFVALTELSRAMGRGQLRRMFLSASGRRLRCALTDEDGPGARPEPSV